jgi:hypothetical protein
MRTKIWSWVPTPRITMLTSLLAVGQFKSEIVVRQSLLGGDVGTEVEESPLLEAIK